MASKAGMEQTVISTQFRPPSALCIAKSGIIGGLFFTLSTSRHQEIDHPIDGRAAVRCRDRADELEAPKTCPLCLSMIHQGLDKGWSGPLWVDSSELIE